MKQKLSKYSGFTLVEIMAVTIIVGFIVPCIISIYTFMIKSNRSIALRQSAIQQWYEFFEKLNILMEDYKIDYEEYYNRQMVGCVNWTGFGTWNNFKWNIWLSWYCTEFTAYWNENSTNRKLGLNNTISGAYHDIYYCSSDEFYEGKDDVHKTVKNAACWKTWTKQSYGQYAALFIDAMEPTNQYDDIELWRIIGSISRAIADPDNIQELYLISNDWKTRLFLRRKLVTSSWDFAQYKIQILRLRWFDAGRNHYFDDTVPDEWSYDRQIDTWACDYSMWFEPNNKSDRQKVGWAYSGYYLPKNEEDCRVDLTYWSTSIHTWLLSIYPQNDPDLYWADESRQMNPYMRIFIENWIYLPEFFDKRSAGTSIMNFKIPLQTTINIKSFYKG